MSDHQSGAGGASDRGPGMESQGYGGSPETGEKGQGQQGMTGGYGESQSGAAEGQGSAYAYGQAGGVQGGPQGYGESAAGQASYGAAAQGQAGAAAYGQGMAQGQAYQGQAPGSQQGQGGLGGQPYYGAGQGAQAESMGPQSAQGHYMHGGAGGMPPVYGQPQPGQGYYAAPHYAQYAGYPPPPPPGVYPYPPEAFQEMHQGHAYGAAQGAGHAHGASMSDLMDEVANGGNGLSTLSKMLNFDDPDFWKGALVGAAAVLLLTSDSVQSALFKSGGSENGNGSKESGS